MVEQTYLAITQAIKESQTGGALADRVNIGVSIVVVCRAEMVSSFAILWIYAFFCRLFLFLKTSILTNGMLFWSIVQTYNDILVLSLGNGQHTVGYDAREMARWGAGDWLSNKGEAPLIDMVFNASADMVDYNLSIIFQSQQCPSNYLRIQVHPGSVT